MVVGEVTRVFQQNSDIRKGGIVAVVVCVVVPDGDFVADRPPSGHIVGKGAVQLARAVVQRVAEAGLNRAEADYHVVRRFGELWRLARVLICKGLHQRVRVDFFHSVRHGVYKAEQRAGRAALLFVDCSASVTLAVVSVVVLRNVDDDRLVMALQLLHHVFRHNAEHVWVCQAELAIAFVEFVAAGDALAVDQRVVFRVALKILSGGQSLSNVR